MSTFTKEQLIARINQVTAINKYRISRDPSADGLAMDNELLAIALASLEAEAVGEVIEQQSGMMLDGLVISEKPIYRNIKGIHNMKMMPLGTQFYAAPPAPVSVPDAATAIRACMEEFPESVHDIVEECAAIAESACRGAMLNQEKGNG